MRLGDDPYEVDHDLAKFLWWYCRKRGKVRTTPCPVTGRIVDKSSQDYGLEL